MGCAQLEQLENFVSAKRRIASSYNKALSGLSSVTLASEAPWANSSFWMYTIMIGGGSVPTDRHEVAEVFRRRGIETRPLWQPLHCSPAHQGRQSYHCEVAETIYQQALSLPCSVNLSSEEQRSVIAAVTDLLDC